MRDSSRLRTRTRKWNRRDYENEEEEKINYADDLAQTAFRGLPDAGPALVFTAVLGQRCGTFYFRPLHLRRDCGRSRSGGGGRGGWAERGFFPVLEITFAGVFSGAPRP